jgi:hypothetical protein
MKRIFEATIKRGFDSTREIAAGPDAYYPQWIWFGGGTGLVVEDHGDGTYTDYGCFAHDKDGCEYQLCHTFTADQIILGRELHA